MRGKTRTRAAWLLAIPMVTFAVVAAAARSDPATAAPSRAGTHPPGNDGTVKVDGVPFDDRPDNEPHVGCAFQIDFYGYDEGDLSATYDFQLWAPTGSGSLESGSVAIGEDAASGGTDLDASVTVDLQDELAASGVPAHPRQGYHVRLTVHAEGSIGADTKHKMLWVECAVAATTIPPVSTTPPAGSSTPPVSTTPPATVSGTTLTPPASSSGPPATSSSTPPATSSSTPPATSSSTPPATSSSTPPATVSGTTVTPPTSHSHGTTAPPTVAAATLTPPGGGLAFTGSETVWAALLALGLLLLGSGSLWMSRRRGRSD
ncbi:MAG: LPXTG cell wall anchor domain-containing protein [Candidatus Velamenicoccus archaeovorus]